MPIQPINPFNQPNQAHQANGAGAQRAQAPQPRRPEETLADSVELSNRGVASSESSEADARASRLEALRDAIASGRYSLPDDAIARAMVKAANEFWKP
ncbi:MAG: flagellar biosynthesis anti-sigma factor FlgM [Armatimonadetes bacterium]|nr:flagellar biosynthesis anti-sigma factor FlgM [Armatimonadota bacterium]